MANILDYLDWRGDLSFEESAFNEVDSLVLSELSFLDFNYSSDFSDYKCHTLAAVVPFAVSTKSSQDLGVLVPDQIPFLAEKASQTRRFSRVIVADQLSRIDETKYEQFSAVTFLLSDDLLYVAFRGTDDTLAGWREDFNLGIMQEIPSHSSSLNYLESIAFKYPSFKIIVGGHSKGGNLAVYSSVFSSHETQHRILSVYNHDGPGFLFDIQSLEAHKRIEDRIITILPEASVVGMLLEHESKYTIVHSTNAGLFQHDGFSWQVIGTHFVVLPELSETGKIQQKAIRDFISSLSIERRIEFINTFFEVLECSNAHTLTDLKNGGTYTAGKMLHKLRCLNKDSRNFMIQLVKTFLSIGVQSAVEEIQPLISQRHQAFLVQMKDAFESLDFSANKDQ